MAKPVSTVSPKLLPASSSSAGSNSPAEESQAKVVTPNRVLNPVDTQPLEANPPSQLRHWHDTPVYRVKFKTDAAYQSFSNALKASCNGVDTKGKIKYSATDRRVTIHYYPRVMRAFMPDGQPGQLFRDVEFDSNVQGGEFTVPPRNPYLYLHRHIVKAYDRSHNKALKDKAACWDARQLVLDKGRSNASRFKTEFVTDRGAYLKAMDIVCQGSFLLGETHGHGNPARFIMDNLGQFKSKGFGTLFKEGIFHELQPLIDAYYEQADEAVPVELGKILGKEDADLLMETRRHGIRLVGIDSQKTYSSIEDEFDPSEYRVLRTKAMNEEACQIIARERGDSLFMGHFGHAHILQSSDSIPGIAAVFPECTTLIMADMHPLPENLRGRFGILNGDFHNFRESELTEFRSEYTHANVYTRLSFVRRSSCDLYIDAALDANLKLS